MRELRLLLTFTVEVASSIDSITITDQINTLFGNIQQNAYKHSAFDEECEKSEEQKMGD